MTDNNGKTGPLAGLKVVEVGTLIAGPFCGQLLADFGAEVIKIEPPTVGDPMRKWGKTGKDGQGLWFAVIGRNKKSITLDLRQPEGQALARRLISQADILVENFRPGTLEKWGLGYEALSAENPGLIMARMSGFGQDGPYRGRAGFGAVGESMGGLRYITGSPDRPPARCGVSIGDSLTGMFGVIGILSAVHARHATGRGQVIDAALYESVLAITENMVTEYDQIGHIRERTGSILKGVAPSNTYPCGDGLLVAIGANGDGVFQRLCAAMQRPEWLEPGVFKTHDERGARQDELDGLIEAWTMRHTSAEVLDLMEQHGVPAGLIYRAPEMLTDPQFIARQAIIEAPHPSLGQVKMQGVFPKLSETPGGVNWPGPPLGGHNAEIYGERLGLTAEEMATLAAKGAI